MSKDFFDPSVVSWHHCNKQTSSLEKQTCHKQPAFIPSCFDLKGISGEAEMSKDFFDPSVVSWLRQPRGAKGGR